MSNFINFHHHWHKCCNFYLSDLSRNGEELNCGMLSRQTNILCSAVSIYQKIKCTKIGIILFGLQMTVILILEYSADYFLGKWFGLYNVRNLWKTHITFSQVSCFVQLVQNPNTFSVLTQENVCKTENNEKELAAENLYHLTIKLLKNQLSNFPQSTRRH